MNKERGLQHHFPDMSRVVGTPGLSSSRSKGQGSMSQHSGNLHIFMVKTIEMNKFLEDPVVTWRYKLEVLSVQEPSQAVRS